MDKEYQGLICIDLDGTLLNEHDQISDFSLHVLHKAIEKGYIVILCSGRPYRGMKPTVDRLGAPFPIVSYNGGLIFHPGDPSFPVIKHCFASGDIRSLYERLAPYCRYFRCEDGTRIYLNEDETGLDLYFNREDMAVVQGPLSETVREDCFTFLCSYEMDHKATIKNLAKISDKYHLRFWRGLLYAELFFPEGDKGHALRYLMDYYGIDRDHVYAFGDGSNDRTMLETAGHPFAMANAKEGLLSAGFPATKKGNAEDGVALTLIEELKL